MEMETERERERQSKREGWRDAGRDVGKREIMVQTKKSTFPKCLNI